MTSTPRALGLAGLCLAAALAAAGPALGESPKTERSDFIIDPMPADGAEHLARHGEPLLATVMHTEAAARLEQDITLGGKTFPAGTVLFAATKGPAPYFCAQASSAGQSFWGVFFTCFQDPGGAGAFTVVNHAKGVEGGGKLVGLLNNGTVTDFSLRKDEPLPAPARYTVLDHKDGLPVPVSLRWIPRRGSGDKPTELGLYSFIGTLGSPGHRADGPSVYVKLIGDETHFAYAGARFTVLGGLGADGSLRYRVDQPFPAGPFQMLVKTFQAPIIIYLH